MSEAMARRPARLRRLARTGSAVDALVVATVIDTWRNGDHHDRADIETQLAEAIHTPSFAAGARTCRDDLR
ncbi:MAG: hypothetical protein ACRDIL_19660 [Candidatus Limnocylindrales bacterium]